MKPPSERDDSKIGAGPKPIHLRFLFGPPILSLILAAIIASYAPFGTIEYLRGYAFLFAIACLLAIIGTKMKVQRYNRAAVGVLWLAPLLPIAIPGLLFAVMGSFK